MPRVPARLPYHLTIVAPCCWASSGCAGNGGGGGGSPAPTPTPTPTTFTLQGQVSEEEPFGGTKIAGAKVEFVDGANAGKSATTNANGNYSITGLSQGGFTVRASATGYLEVSRRNHADIRTSPQILASQ